jgi:hypothetical protein
MAFKIPEKVKIGGITYEVKQGVERLVKGQGYSAEIIYEDAVINLAKGCEVIAERDLWHEVIHAIKSNLGYKNHDEKEIDELAGALYALIVDNPEMFGG